MVAPRPTATARDRAGNPLNRDDYAARLLAQLVEDTAGTGGPKTLTAGQAYAVARLLDELAGVYRDEDLGALARQMSELLDPRRGGSDL